MNCASHEDKRRKVETDVVQGDLFDVINNFFHLVLSMRVLLPGSLRHSGSKLTSRRLRQGCPTS